MKICDLCGCAKTDKLNSCECECHNMERESDMMEALLSGKIVNAKGGQ